MQHLHPAMRLAALAAGISLAAFVAGQTTRAADEENATVKTDPGFDQSGKLNTGEAHHAPSNSTQIIKIPSPEESQKAVMMPDPKDPAPGKADATSGGGSGAGQTSADVQQQSQPAGTTGLAPAETANWPIGSTGQTAPAKFYVRNDILDRTPMMALPLPLSGDERTHIFKEIMADKTQPSADAADLKPASELTTQMALNDMRPLPQSLSDNAWINKLKYVKAKDKDKDKVFLVEPSTRIVVEQITQ